MHMTTMQATRDVSSGRLRAGMTFDEKVWAVTARIPRGCVATYGDIAKTLGTRGYRAVGAALNRNPFSPRVPCHRVVGSSGALTGFASGLEKKRAMLRDEGISFAGAKVDLARHRFQF
jgi:methylated-DNA-[protein]-cysteine S-methyltransferase